MIAARGEQGFYHSVQDVPEPLRTQLIRTTTSPNSGTIVIADRAGKEQLTNALSRRQNGFPEPAAAADAPAFASVTRNQESVWLPWAALALVLILAIICWMLFSLHW